MLGGFSAPMMISLANDKNRVIFTLPFIYINPTGNPLSLEILIDRPVTKLPSTKWDCSRRTL